MFRVPLEELKKKIKESASLSDEQLQEKIKQKMAALSGLISEEGATHIIANELGIQLAKEEGSLVIKNLMPGMRGVEVAGKVTKKFEIREFQSQSRSGKVGSLILADETGTVRVAFWNAQADHLQTINEGDIIKLKNVYVRENRGSRELHVNDSSNVFINPEGVTLNIPDKPSTSRKSIKDLSGGEENVELLSTIVSVFNPTFFSICSKCNKRVKQEEGVFNCLTDGQIEPSYSYVLNVILDDGSETIRAVLWKAQTQALTKKTDQELLTYKDHPEQFEAIKTDLLGEIIKVAGRVKRNDMFERLEFIIDDVVHNPDPKEELQKLENQE